MAAAVLAHGRRQPVPVLLDLLVIVGSLVIASMVVLSAMRARRAIEVNRPDAG